MNYIHVVNFKQNTIKNNEYSTHFHTQIYQVSFSIKYSITQNYIFFEYADHTHTQYALFFLRTYAWV